MFSEIVKNKVTPVQLSKNSSHRISQDVQILNYKAESSQTSHDTVRELIIPIARFSWDGVERRQPDSCRRQSTDRRRSPERRLDTRINSNPKRSVKAKIHSIISARLGVDRRKGGDRRIIERRSTSIRSLVTPEELDALLRL